MLRKVSFMVLLVSVLAWISFSAAQALAQRRAYVGADVCSHCHPQEYENFTSYAKKAHSAKSVQMMAPKLTSEELQECFHCHTTGYGEPGGFISFEKTPDLANAGCEVCHGPGSEHVDSGGDPALIKGRLTLNDCVGCHNEERVSSFNFKPLIYGGAH